MGQAGTDQQLVQIWVSLLSSSFINLGRKGCKAHVQYLGFNEFNASLESRTFKSKDFLACTASLSRAMLK